MSDDAGPADATDESGGAETTDSSDGAESTDSPGDADSDAEFLLTRHETPEGTLVAVCDADVLGESFEEGSVSLAVEETFYGGDDAEPVDADAVVEGLYDADTANLVGEDCVGLAVDAGIIDEERVLEVGGTLHAQLLWL